MGSSKRCGPSSSALISHASIVYPVATDTEFRAALERDYGRVVEGRGPRQSAEDVARAVVSCVISPKAEVYTLKRAWWLAVLSVVAPAKADRFMKRFGRHVVPPDSSRAS